MSKFTLVLRPVVPLFMGAGYRAESSRATWATFEEMVFPHVCYGRSAAWTFLVMEGAAEVEALPSNGGQAPSALLQPTLVGARRLIRVSGVDLDVGALRVTVDGVTMDLPYKEFQLLRLLMQHAGNLVPKQLIMDQVWRPGHPDSNRTLEVHVLRLRRRLKPRPDSPARLRTVRGHGYIFDILDDDHEDRE